MKKFLGFSLLFGLFLLINSEALPQSNKISFDKIRLLPEDIPQGFMYAIIPDTAKETLKFNPWEFDNAAIQKLSDKIYPGGDYKQISAIHMTILANKKTPHRDDIVCYIIQYKDILAAREEATKISSYAGHNQDRAIVHVKNKIVVFMFVDDVGNFSLLQELNKKITERIEKI